MIAKDGLSIIFASAALFLVSVGIWLWLPGTATSALMTLLGLLLIFNLYFFRDPERETPNNRLAVISPADGRIVRITNVNETEYFNREVRRISIFLSVFDVHVNRTPVSGRIDYFNYHTGKFLMAFKEDASRLNEQTSIGIVNDFGHRVLFKQIAGLIARRIVCHLREGEAVQSGERMGMIRFGSRVDVFLPFDATVHVQTGQRVRCGETVLATFPERGVNQDAEEQIVELPKTEIST